MVEERYQQAYANKEIEFFVERDSLKGIFSAPREWMRPAQKSNKAYEKEPLLEWIKIHISILDGRHYVPCKRGSGKHDR